MLTFVCDQCGATGSVQAPGSARCTECGYVALVKPPSGRQMPEPDPFASPSPELVRAARSSVAVNGPPRERRATLWVRPGPEEAPTTDPYVIPTPPRPPRAATGTFVALVLLAGSAALAVAAVAVVGPRWLDRGGTSSAPRAAAPVQQPAPSPSIAPVPPASAERVRPIPARRTVASSSASPAKGALANPAPEDRRCVPRALRARPDLTDRLPAEVAVRFRVTASGDVARIEVLDLPDRGLADAVSEAVRSCRFSPGTDENGRPVALPITMRIRFAAPPEATNGF